MKRWTVAMHVTVRRTVEVEAETSHDAAVKAANCEWLHEGHDEDMVDWEEIGTPKEIED